ncbi:MAG: hypothetical protein AB4911_22310 [Oscillochloridaceae bacterium umkhey_bin13]
MYTVSITRLRVRSIIYMPLFMLHAMRTVRQVQKAQGVLGVETRFEQNNVVWTKTIWNAEADMKQYRNSGAHQIAMRLLSSICSEAAYVRWTQDEASLPSWEAAHQRLLNEGKLSKVKHPSPLHAAGKTAPDAMMPGLVPPMPPR